MKYFAKYLKVAEEIQENDTVTNGTDIRKCLHVDSGVMKVTDTPLYVDMKNWWKVSLFLCTNNFKEGDRVQSDRHNHTELVTNLENFLRIDSKAHKSFKVISEISPAAIWVKEGDKFEENQIQKVWGINVTAVALNSGHKNSYSLTFEDTKPKDQEIESRLDHELGKPHNFGTSYISWDGREPSVKFVKLKCSNCNTFH